MAYPSTSDLTAFLTAAGITLPAGIDLATPLGAAIEEWERVTGHSPFLATGSDTLVRYDPPGPNPPAGYPRRMGGGTLMKIRTCVSVEAVRVGVCTDDAGDLLVEYDDYVLEGTPIRKVRFLRPVYGAPRSVSVLGDLGYASSITLDVKEAILCLAGASVAQQVKQGLSAGVVEWREADVSERRSIELIQSLGDAWEARGLGAARHHMRWD